ncbi:substrate-binding periplasmic protein [Chitinimonas lacunae]|uniref:Substrate-binding periplasmic protein n=1 Tax=Chitinimonas lacunae TaxID=1963018 RepID=A0ABV8MKA1_9NEIS
MKWLTLCTVLLVQAESSPMPGEEVKVATFSVAPYVVDMDGSVRGALVEFFDQEIAPRMGVRFRWLPPMTVARLLRSLETGSADMAPILSYAPERRRQVDYASQAYIRFEPVLAVRPNSHLQRITDFSQLDGLRIGWVKQSVLEPALQRPAIQWDMNGEVQWERSNMGKLQLGRIDAAFFSNPYTPLYFAKGAGYTVRTLPLPLRAREVFAAFSKTASPRLLGRYEHAAQEAFANKRFEQHLQRYIEQRTFKLGTAVE